MKKFDLQDALLAGGFLSLLAGLALIYVPAALIAAGAIALVLAIWIEQQTRLAAARTRKK